MRFFMFKTRTSTGRKNPFADSLVMSDRRRESMDLELCLEERIGGHNLIDHVIRIDG